MGTVGEKLFHIIYFILFANHTAGSFLFAWCRRESKQYFMVLVEQIYSFFTFLAFECLSGLSDLFHWAFSP